MRSTFATIAALLALVTAGAGPPRQQPPQAANADLRPVTLAVVNRANGAPVAAFDCQFSYEAPGLEGPSNRDAWIPVRSPGGTVDIQAPISCRLEVRVRSPDYIGDDPYNEKFIIRSTDKTRRVEFSLRRGITVRGTVRDSRTRAPIVGATVAPYKGRFLSLSPDEDKQVKTGVNGRYEVRGAHPEVGVEVSHPDYIHDRELTRATISGPERDVFLRPIPTIALAVVDTVGKPLAGATALDRPSVLATSGKDGRLIFRRPGFLDELTIHRDGFIDRSLDAADLEAPSMPRGPVVVLEPAIALDGRVVGPDGRPVGSFAVAAGPGRLPGESECVRREVRDRDGRFALGLAKEGTYWLGVVAEGFAAWEDCVEVRRGGKPPEIRLAPGVAVTGLVEVPEARRKQVRGAARPPARAVAR